MLEGHSVTLVRKGRRILHDLTINLRPGELVGLMGANGAGKSSLLRVLAGIEISGLQSVSIAGQALARYSLQERARAIAYLPQTRSLAWAVSVLDVVGLGRLPHGADLAQPVAQWCAAQLEPICRAIASCGLEDFMDRPATALSEGEKARVLLARALAVEADYLLADEPLASLDPRHQIALGQALQHEARKGRGIMLALHDPNLAIQLCDRIILLKDGRVIADGPPDQALTAETLEQAFTIKAQAVLDQDRFIWRFEGLKP